MKFPPTRIERFKEGSIEILLKKFFGPLGCFIGSFLTFSNPIISIGTLTGILILAGSLNDMLRREKKTFSLILAGVGALFAIVTYLPSDTPENDNNSSLREIQLSGNELFCKRRSRSEGVPDTAFWLDNGKLYDGYPEPLKEVSSTKDVVQKYQIVGRNKVEFRSYLVGLEGLEEDHWLIDFDKKYITVLTGDSYTKKGQIFVCDSYVKPSELTRPNIQERVNPSRKTKRQSQFDALADF
jgi:hypothetical protein